MQILPNHLLAQNKSKLCSEQRVIFMNDKEKKMLEAMLGAEGIETQKTSIDPEIKNIGWVFRKKAEELSLIKGGGKEKIAEFSELKLEDLLEEMEDYNIAIEGIEKKSEDFRDPLYYDLIGGEEGKSVRLYQQTNLDTILPYGMNAFEHYSENEHSKYNSLLEIQASLGGQQNANEVLKGALNQAREELSEERSEHLALLLQERQSILNQIESKITQAKNTLDFQIKKLEAICPKPSALKEHFESGEEVGFFDYIKKQTQIAELLNKIKAGNATSQEIIEANQNIKNYTEKVEDRQKSIQRIQTLDIQKTTSELKKENDSILAFYRLSNSKELNPQKAPSDSSEKKLVLQLIEFENKLESGEVEAEELIFIEDVLPNFKQTISILHANQVTLEHIANLDDHSATEIQKTLEENIDLALNSKIPSHPELRKIFNQSLVNLKILQSQLSESNLKQFAFSQGYLNADGKIQSGLEESIRKSWLAQKRQEFEKNQVNINKSIDSPFERVALRKERTNLEEYFKKLADPNSNPVEIIETLEQQGNLELVPGKEFNRKYKATGVTDSYFVIEQTGYKSTVAHYAQEYTNWKIYLDEDAYNHIKGEPTNIERTRFKARIAHELGHREFDAFKKEELMPFCENPHWNALKTEFLKLASNKQVIVGEERVDYNDEFILNESWALLKEWDFLKGDSNVVLPKKFKSYIEKFNKLINPKTVYGSMWMDELEDTENGKVENEQKTETGEDNLESSINSKEEERESKGRTEKEEEAIKNARDNFEAFKDYLEIFGGSDLLKTDDNQKENTDNEKVKTKPVLNITKLPKGSEFLNSAAENFPFFQKQIEMLESAEADTVQKLNEYLDDYNTQFQYAEEKLSSEESETSGVFQDLWKNTRFISVDDIYHMVTECWEFTQRRRNRNSEDARAAVGQKIFGKTLLGNEYLSKQQKIEMEEVNEYQGNLKNMSHEQVYPLLYQPKNKDHFKAVIGDLCERGRMRWDDHRVWNSLSRYSFVQIPNPKRADKDIEYRNTWLKKIVADIWDENTWDGWIKSNDSGFNTSISDLEPMADTLHACGGAPVVKKLEEILCQYKDKKSNFSNSSSSEIIYPSHRYHKFLDYSFDKGKLSMEDKFYFMIEGVASHALRVEDLRKIQSKYFPKLPLLDFFYAHNNTYGELNKLSKKINKYAGGDDRNWKAGVHKLIMQDVLTDEIVLSRISKRAQDASQVDHDDWQTLMATMNNTKVKSMLAGEMNPKISDEGLKNSLASFSTFIKSQVPSVEDDVAGKDFSNITRALSTFVEFDGTLMKRVHLKRETYVRLGSSHRDTKPGMGGAYTVRQYQTSMYHLIEDIFHKYAERTGKQKEYGKEYTKYLFQDNSKWNQDKSKLPDNITKGEDYILAFETKINEIAKTQEGKEIISTVLKEHSDPSKMAAQGKQRLLSYMESGEDDNFDYS